MEPFLSTVEDFLSLKAPLYSLIDVVRNFEAARSFHEACPCVLGGLEQAGNHGGFETTKVPGFLVPLDQPVLIGPQTPTQNALPLGMLYLEGAQGSQECVCLFFILRCAGPHPDVVVAGCLAAVLQLRDLGGRPSQRLRELPAVHAGLSA